MSDAKYQVPEHMHVLLNTFTEMMTGEASPENIDLVLQWAVYMHIRGVMPPMVQHWNNAAPEEAAKVKDAIQKMRQLNEAYKASRAESKQES